MSRPLLIVNPQALHLRLAGKQKVERILELLVRNGVQADLCAEADQQAMRRRVRAAVRDGCPLVIAAGGDGTMEAVAPALIGSPTMLGIIPLGTYNNLAACLGIPMDLESACALLSRGVASPIDIGQVRCHGARRPQYFLEQCSIGLGALLAPVGEGLQKGHWLEAIRALPAALRLEPIPMRIRIGDQISMAETLLVTICNAPRSAAALLLAPQARMDDGLLDVCVYAGLHQAQLAAHLFEFMSQGVKDQPGVWRSPATSLELSSTTAERLLAAADAEVVGTTPARFAVLPAALRVVGEPRRD